MERLTDAELVERARQGTSGAFAELVRRYQREVYALACSLLSDRAEAEDMAQEAFVRALRNLDLLADPAKFGPWLRRVTFGVCIDWLRAFRPELYRSSLRPDAESAAEPHSAEPSPLERLEQLELSARVLAAVEQLPPRYRVPLTLFHLDGLSHAKVAAALEVPVGTVRSLVTRARQKLAPLLQDYATEVMPMNSRLEEVFAEQSARPPRLLHLLNGDATREKLERSEVPGTFSVWADVLHEGPVPADLSDERLREVRARFIAGAGWATYEQALEQHRRWDAGLESYTEHDEVVLWFEHDLFDQLLLIHHLDWFARRELGRTRLSLICIGAYPGIEPFYGLGQLSPDQLASLLDTRQRVSSRQLALGRAAWRAFTAPDPAGLERLLDGDTSALPFLEGALRRFLEEYPSVRNGLSRTERQILQLLANGPQSPMALFQAMYPLEERVFMGDWTFWHRVRQLAAGEQPLVELAVGEMEHRLPEGEVRISEAGREVLAGREDAVRLRGIERWLGGVQLQGPEVSWRWDEAVGRLRREVHP